MNNDIYYIECKNLNEKSHDLYNIYFKKYFNKIKINNLEYLINFIKNNNNYNNILLFYNQGNKEKKKLMINLMDYLINTKDNIKIKIVLFIFDFWRTGEYYNNLINNKINNIKNFYILNSANIEKYNFFNNYKFKKCNKYIKYFYTWSSYNLSFINFNNNPINKILLTGNLNINHYPQRNFIKKFNNIIIYNYNKNDIKYNNNNYNIELNKYIGCFYSNVFIKRINDNNYYNTKILLLKFYEILSSGSLLVCSNNEIDLFNKYNLKNKIHYYAINLEQNNNKIQEEINYICDKKNKKIIDKIRYNGQIFSKKYLNSKIKFNELNNILNNL